MRPTTKKSYMQSLYVFNYVFIFFLLALRLLDIYTTSLAIASGTAIETNPLARAFFEDGNITELVILNLVLILGLTLINYYAYWKKMTNVLIIILVISIIVSILTYQVIYINLRR